MRAKADGLCTYCLATPGVERDHVVARQFFPPDQKWRGDLPQVPCCGRCNREKQKAEDVAGVVMQLGDSSEGARSVRADRVPRTLAHNQRLAAALRRGFHRRVTVRRESGLLVPAMAIELKGDQLSAIECWYRYVVRGLYRHETAEPLPLDHDICLVRALFRKPFDQLRVFIRCYESHQVRSLADGEFQYLFATGCVDNTSMWVIAFRSIQMGAITFGPDCAADLRSLLDSVDWKVPPESDGPPATTINTAGP